MRYSHLFRLESEHSRHHRSGTVYAQICRHRRNHLVACHRAAHGCIVCGCLVVVQFQGIVHVLAVYGQLVDNGIIVGICRRFQHGFGQKVLGALAEVRHQGSFYRIDSVFVRRRKIGVFRICRRIAHTETVVAAVGEVQGHCGRLGIVQPELRQIGTVFLHNAGGVHRCGVVGQRPQGRGVHGKIFPAGNGICRMVISGAAALCGADHFKASGSICNIN